MYDTFSNDLEKANTEESASQKAFEDEIAVKTAQNKELQELVTGKEVKKSEAMNTLSVTEEELANEQSSLKYDEELFISARDACKEKSDAWDERCRLRTAELDGIHKALEILTSDDARDTFLNATSTRAIDTFGSDGVDVDIDVCLTQGKSAVGWLPKLWKSCSELHGSRFLQGSLPEKR